MDEVQKLTILSGDRHTWNYPFEHVYRILILQDECIMKKVQNFEYRKDSSLVAISQRALYSNYIWSGTQKGCDVNYSYTMLHSHSHDYGELFFL